MNRQNEKASESASGIGKLSWLPTIRATEFDRWSCMGTTSDEHTAESSGAFTSERDYRFCKIVVMHPLRRSSEYPRLAGVSTKTAIALRRVLVEKGLLRERLLEGGGRGRGSILLEPTAAGVAAVAEYESRVKER